MKTTIEDVPSLLLRLHAGDRAAPALSFHRGRRLAGSLAYGELVDRVDVHTLDRESGPAELGLHDIGRVRIRTAKPVAFDAYARNRATGGFIVIDESSNETVGAGMIVPAAAPARA